MIIIEVVICPNCKSNQFLNNNKEIIKKFFEMITVKNHINTLEKVIITSDEHEQYKEAVCNYSRGINKNMNVSQGGVAVVASGMLDNKMINYVFYKESIVTNTIMMIINDVYGSTSLLDEMKEMVEKICIPTIYHELGHIIDYENRLFSGCYINDYEVNSKDKYLKHEILALWSEYFANRFMYKNTSSKECGYEDSIIDRINNIRFKEINDSVKDTYRILYDLCSYIAYIHDTEKEPDLYNRIENKRIVNVLKHIDEELKKIYGQFKVDYMVDTDVLIKYYEELDYYLYEDMDMN